LFEKIGPKHKLSLTAKTSEKLQIMENRLIQPGKILTRDDLKQVTAIIEQATACNTRRAYRKDLTYFWSWAAAQQIQPRYPVAVDVIV
jgi:hypothetical protein